MSHQVRLDDDVYERIKHKKRDDETFSQAVDRLTSEWTLLDFAAGEPTVDPDSHREALDASRADDEAETVARLERMGIDLGE